MFIYLQKLWNADQLLRVLVSFKTIANIIIVDAQGLVQFLGLKFTLMLFF